MREDAYKPLLFKELLMVLDVPKDDLQEFEEVIEELEAEGRIFKTHKDRYGVPDRMSLAVGRLQGNERGYGFVIPDEEGVGDVFITAEALNGAMHNDRVIARISKKTTADKRSEGEIIRILKRANNTVVGTFEKSKYFGFVVPDNARISGDIFIPRDEFNNAKPGQKVIAELVKWPEKRRNAEGRIVEIIGNANEAGVDILSIIKAHNFIEEFPEDVIKQAEDIDDSVTEEMLEGRRDLRGLTMVTIDGEDAKDLDDAVSIERLANGNYRLGVHIADVSRYVTEGSPLDQEALKRGTSVYLVDRVIPMLPKKLSNGICSLNPQVDRLAFSVMMDVDSSGRVVDHEIFESVIKTNERMTYTNVYKILVENDSELISRYNYLIEDFKSMEELAAILRKKRFARGAIDFDFEEAKIILDEKGRPVEVRRYEITIANKIIEEFMLVCNETVAEHFYWANCPFVYRIHEDPDAEKISSFNEFIHNLGYNVKGINKIHPRALQELLERVKGKREERIISTVMLRSLQKARYSNENGGHFGLAAKYYCHFTSPIRRYPDLIIHRIMKEYIKGQMGMDRQEVLNSRLPGVAKLCSERERASEEAERETEDLKKVEFMKQQEGEVFEGIISNVTSFGMFIELDNTIEGLVRMSSMEDDYYIYNDKQYYLIGERSRKIYRIGDIVNVKLARADIAARKIDFVLVEAPASEEAKSAPEHVKEQKPAKIKRGKKTMDPKVKKNIMGKGRRKKS
ncbi:RNAse R [Anaerobacterium chartisolvens]|uniref:Ribonuclease R n=2 Tax=Anaerobacterium chartisolvens TaxID=1297424 RepID=A0A369BA55_9FIRM|nr:RNAse R [Anaerobacterium chartisolvens]